MKVALAFNTKDRVEQVKKIVPALLQPDKFDLYWYDGSETPEGQRLPEDMCTSVRVAESFENRDRPVRRAIQVRSNVRGSGDNAVVQALSMLLASPSSYTHIGICEDDILLDKN